MSDARKDKQAKNQGDLLPVDPCDPDKEQVVSYYKQAAAFFLLHFNHTPSRTTLYKYLRDGYPVEYGGPYVTMPYFMKLKRPYTTIEALERFLTVVRKQEKKLAKISGRNGRAAQARKKAG